MSDDRPSGDGVAGAASAGQQSAFSNIDSPPETAQSGVAGVTISGAFAALAGAARLDLVLDVPVRLSVELGRAEVPIREVVNLGRGSVIELDRALGEPLDVRVNGVLIGRGEIVVVNEERLGLRFVEVVSQAERATRLS